MIEFILGKTGSGKSYLAVKTVADILVNEPEVHILTNLSLDLARLNVLLKERFPTIEPDVVGRVHFLSDEQCRKFYLYREPGNVLEPTTPAQQKELVFPDFDGASKRSGAPIVYVIDEAHIFFDAREWAQVGPTLNFFASQHRKFRVHRIILITQFLDQVEKRLRNHSVKFTECVNYGVRRLALWKLPKVFRTLETYKAPPCPSETSANYRIDPALADCYDTSAGVGVSGGNGPEKVRRKGLPFWTLPAAALAAAVALWFAPDLAVRGLLGAFGGSDPRQAEKLPVAPSQPLALESGMVKPAAQNDKQGNIQPAAVAIEAPRPPPPRVRSWLVRGNLAMVTMEDGRVLTEADPEFGGIARRGNAVWVDGVKSFMVPPLVVPRPAPQMPVKGKETASEGPSPGSSYQGEAVVPTPESAAASSRLSTLGMIPSLSQAPASSSSSSRYVLPQGKDGGRPK